MRRGWARRSWRSPAPATRARRSIPTWRAGWLSDLGLADAALRCGPQEPRDKDARDDLIRRGEAPAQVDNNCSGKHCGFLTVTRHLGAGPDYVDPDHPTQRAVRAAWEEVTEEESPGFGIDGCSAPNFATSLVGLARAMVSFATASGRSGARAAAQARLMAAMIARPELVHGEGGTCTRLMRACEGRAAVKGGAEGVYVAMLPDAGLGIALKIEDGVGPRQGHRDRRAAAPLRRLARELFESPGRCATGRAARSAASFPRRRWPKPSAGRCGRGRRRSGPGRAAGGRAARRPPSPRPPAPRGSRRTGRGGPWSPPRSARRPG